MASIPGSAQKRFSSFAKRPDLPPWWKAAQVLLAAGFVLYLSYSIVTGGDTGTAETPVASGPVATVGTTPSSTPGTPVESSTPTTATPGAPATVLPAPTTLPAGAGQELLTENGEMTTMPGDAVTAARAAAVASFTGVWDDVPLAAGSVGSAPVVRYSDPKIVDVRVVGDAAAAEALASAGTVGLSISVDPDDAGVQPVRVVIVQVTQQAGRWVYNL